MKVLYIIDTLQLGGKERRLVELLKGLGKIKQMRYELVVLSDDIFYDYVNNQDVVVHKLIRKNRMDPNIFVKLYKICKEFQPDIIHSWESMSSVYAIPIAKLLRIKFINAMITNATGNVKIFGKGWIRAKLTFPFSDMVIANSHAGLRAYNVPRSKSFCVHNGIDFSRLTNLENPEEVRKRFNIKFPKIVGMVAGFSVRKDYETYLRAAMRILEKRNDVIFLAVGDGSTLERCKKIVKPEFRERVEFLGRRKNVEAIVNTFDIGVLVTNHDIHAEGISNSILEYMALGKPALATEGGGTSEIVIHGKTGFLIPPKDAVSLAQKIEFLLNNPAKAKSLGTSGKERVKREFSLEKMTDRTFELYQQCIQANL